MAFDQLLKKNFWAVIGLLTAVVAFLNAEGITQLVGASLAPDEKQLSLAPPMAKAAAPGPTAVAFHTTSSDPIFARNPFDSVTGPLTAKPIDLTDDVAPAPEVNTDPMAAPACDGVKVLVITASSDPDWSMAVMMNGTDPKSLLRRRGGEVGSKTVKFIGWDRVWLTGGAQLCQARMFAPPTNGAAPPPPPQPVAAQPAAGAAPGLDPAIAKGIQKVSGTEFNVDRGVVDKILENQADLMRQARIVPEQENGKVVGIRMFGVRPDTLLGVLGMENGDRLQTINGFDMASPEKALEAYARLRTADHLTVQVNRRGQNMNLDYNIK
jgi:general secretion pathway protein C